MLALLVLGSMITDADAQSNRSKKGRAKESVKKADIPTVVVPSITVDTTIADPVVSLTQTATDTTKKDTSGVSEVAQVVHDSVKAQLKAPIVQVPVRLKTLIIPGALFAYGAITLNGGLRQINEEAKELFWDGKTHGRPYIEDYLLLAPAAAVYVLNIAGLKGQNNLIDRSIMYGMANLISNGIIFGVKQVGIETRPDGSDNHSFPSGHTAQAFVSAEFFHQEYKGRVHWTATAAGYAVGVATAYLRMAHNKHWLGDVVAGAGVGIAATRFSYYLYPLFKHVLFGSKKVRQSAMFMPTYQSGMYGIAFSYGF